MTVNHDRKFKKICGTTINSHCKSILNTNLGYQLMSSVLLVASSCLGSFSQKIYYFIWMKNLVFWSLVFQTLLELNLCQFNIYYNLSVYLDVDVSFSKEIIFNFHTSSNNFERKWNIKVSHISCRSPEEGNFLFSNFSKKPASLCFT